MRSKLSKFLFMIVLGLAVIAMVGFGMGGLLSPSTTASIATVGDADVQSEDYFRGIQNEMSSVSQQLGQNLSIDQALLFGIDRTVLQRLVTQAAFENETLQLEISVGDERIKETLLSNPGFQGLTGAFDKDVYEDALDRSNMDPARYESLVRKDATQLILQNTVAAGAAVPVEGTLAIFDYIGETRAFNYTRINTSHLDVAVPAPTDAQLQSYYDANPAAFTQPLTRQISYVSLTPEDVAATLDISEERIAELYEERSEEFNTPAVRFVERIVLGNMDEATEARRRIFSGEITFEELAAERGLEVADTDLGDVTARDLGAAASETLFATDVPGVYGPLETNVGPAIFRMNAALAAQTIALDEVREQLRTAIAIDDAGGIIADITDEVFDLIAGGATLEEVANETDMVFGTIDLAAGSTDGIAAYSAFRAEATAADIDEERDLVDLEDGGVFALRVDGITESFVKPMADVTADVQTGAAAEITQALILARADKLASVINGSDSVTMANLSYAYGITIEDATNVSRTSNLTDLPPAVLTQAFALTVGQAAVVADVNGAVVIELADVTPFDPTDENAAGILEQIGQQQNQLVATDLVTYFGMAIVNQAAPTVNQARIDSLHLQLQ